MQAFPISLDSPITFPGPLPPETDVVVIGAGVIGISTALFLAERGIRVTVVEKGRVAGEQSSRNWGWIRKQGRDPAELPIVMEAITHWQRFSAECGDSFGLTQGGVTYFAENDREMQSYAVFLKLAGTYGLDTKLVDAAETARLFPGLARAYAGALITPSDMRAEPFLAVPALARLAASKGVTIVEHCAARRLDFAGGKIAGLWTERGLIRASTVLVASGAWSSLFLRAHGISIPQLSVRATVAATDALPEVHAGAAADNRIAFRRRQDGGYTLAPGGASQLYIGPDAFRHVLTYLPALRADPFGVRFHPLAPSGFPDAWTTPRQWQADEVSPFEHQRVLNPAPETFRLEQFKRDFAALYPDLPPVTLKRAWAGMIDTMPDTVPILDRVPDREGLLIATGMSGHGFGIGPGVGRVMTDMITGGDLGHDLHRFRFSRFSDGSRLDLGPSL